jgi:hypothetical protein
VASDESFTDYIQLNAVDHAADVMVAPDNFGNIFAYKPANLISPVSAVSNLGINVLDSVGLEDGHGFNAYSQDYIDIDFGNADISAGARMVLKMKGFLDGTGISKPFVGPPAVVIQSLINGVWTEVGRMRPRFDWDVCAFDVSTFSLDPASGVKFRLFSISHGLKYTNIDYVAIETGAEPAKTVSVAPLSSAVFGGKNVLDLLNNADNQYTNLLPGNHMNLEFMASPQSAAARSFIFTSEGYYIPRGSTYFVATWSGTAWVIHDSYSYASTDETKTFDLSIYLPDPANEMKVRIWQDYAEGASYPASIDFIKLQQGSTVGTLSTATELTGNTSIKTQVQASDNVYWALHNQVYGRTRWTEYKWSGLAVNSVPVVSGLNVVTGSVINWTYTDAENETQKQSSVQVWTGPGGTGSLYWGPDTFTGTGTSVTYAGTPFIYGVTYYLRVKATDGNNWSQWVESSFLYNIQSPPGIYTTSITAITSATATSGGEIFNNGGTAVTARGVCWSTSPLPTISNSRTTDGTGNGTFTSAITGLTGALGVTYYVRAYGTNSVGTGYGPQLSFTYSTPSVSTYATSGITPTSATSGGSVLSDGNSTVTARGVCWNTTGTPTIGDSKTTNGTGAGGYTSSITGLTLGTTYYVRAYATNEFGTSYGSEQNFTASINFCIPATSSNACAYMWITNVTTTGGITNINNNSTCGATSFTDYSTTISASQAPGSAVTMSITSYGYALGISVWIDFNDNGVYASDEKVISQYTGAMSQSASFTVPANAPGGSHKMRVRAEYQAAPSDPCTALTYGETEEYTFSTGSPAPADPTSISASVNPICNGTSTQLTANGTIGTVYWYTASCGGTEVTTGNPITVSPSSTTTYYARNYNNSQYSSGCASVTVTAYSALSSNISGGSSPLCYNTAPGTFTATGSGGTGSYTYLWYKNGSSTGITTQTYAPGNLTATSTFYCAITSGSCGTVNTSTTSITVYGNLTAGIGGGTSPLCYNMAPGTFTATGSGGIGSYTYLWYKNSISTGVTTQTYAPGNLSATSTFYCAITSGSCGTVNSSNTTITVYGDLTAGISGGSSPICFNSAPGTLTATGSNGTGSYTYLWYKNGSSTAVTTQTYAPGNLTATSTFYCAITSGSCGTVNTSTTTITVNSALTAGINGGSSPLCYNTAPGTFTATGGGGTGSYTYLWYKNSTSTGVTTQTYAPGNLAATSTFYCAITSGSCGTVNTSTTTITVYSNLTAGISGGSSPLCYNTAPGTFTASGGGGINSYTYLWYTNGTSTGVTTQTYTPGNLEATTTFYCAITSGSCGTVNTSSTTIAVYGDLTAGISGGSSPICYNSAPGTFTATGGGGTGSYTYLWYKNGTSTGVTLQTYAPGNLSATSAFYCEITSGSCGTVNTSTTTITVFPDFVKGSILTAGDMICYNSDPVAIGSLTAASDGDGTISYQWQSSTDVAFTSPVTIESSNLESYDPPAGLKVTTWYRRQAKDGSCNGFISSDGVWKVTVSDKFMAPVVSSDQIICWNTTAGKLSATAAAGGSGSYSYQWQVSYDGDVWNNINAQTTLSLLPGDLYITTYYRILATDIGTLPCGSLEASNAIKVTVRDPFTPSVLSIAGNQTIICNNTTPGLLSATPTLGGSGPVYTYQWQTKTTGSWANVGTNSLTYQPGNLTKNTQFRLIAFDQGTPACGSVFSLNVLSVSVQAVPNAGSIGSDQTICAGTIPAALTSITNGSTTTPGAVISYKWEYSTSGTLKGSSWDLIESATAAGYAPGELTQSTLFRRTTLSTLNGIACESAPVQVAIIIEALPIASAGGNQTICSTGEAIISGALSENGTILWTENGAGSITAGETTLTPTYTPSAEDAGNAVMLTMTVSSNNVCAPKSAVADYTVNVEALPTAVSGGSQTICSNGTAIVNDASSSNGTILWTENGAGVLTGETTLTPAYTASAEDAGKMVTLTMTVSSTNVCAPESAVAEYTVNVDPLPTAVAGGSQTICSGGIATVDGASSSNGTILWTTDGAGSITSGESSLTPTYATAAADAGKSVILTMTVTSDNNCSPEVATASYNINVRPDFVSPVVSSNQQICYSNSAAPLVATEANGGTGGYTYQWQYSADGVTDWANIDNATTLTYSPGVLMETSSYRVLTADAGTPSCAGEVTSNVVKVIVNNPLYPPIVSSGSDQTTVCYNGIPAMFTAIDATGGTGPFTYQWQMSPNGISNWTNVGLNTIGNTTYQAPATITNTYYRVIAKDVGAPSCGSTFSNALLVTVQIVPSAGSISADQTICGGTAPVALTSISDGTGSGTISYKWDYSLDGTIWVTSENQEAGYTLDALTQTTWFRRATVSTLNEAVCESEYAAPVKIEVLFPAAITGDDREICPGTSTVIGAEASEGSTYSWSSTPGEFTSVEANPTVEPMETTTYVVVETFTATGCTNTNSVVVTVNPLPLPTITGIALVGSGVSGSEYTTEPGFTGYTWTVSAGGVITSGEGTNSILVSWTEPGDQSVSVMCKNEGGCEPLSPAVFNVLVTPVPDAAVITQTDHTLISDAPTGNQWYRDGIAIEGATGTEYDMTEPGTYYVIVTINGSSSVASNSVIYFNVSINDIEVSHMFDVYPNPCKGQFNIKVTSAKPVELNIEIFNTIGVLIWKQEKVKIDGIFIAPVNLNVVPNGAYLVTLRNKSIAVTRRVVIMK